MSFSNEAQESGSGKFANFKDGKIVTRIDGEQKTFTTVSGDIVDIHIETANYKGEYEKVVVWIKHEDGVTQLGFPLLSGYGQSFWRMLPNIDPKKPVKISGGIKKLPNGNSYGSMFIKQEGENLKWFFTKDNEAGKKIPASAQIKDSKGKVVGIDTTKRDDFSQTVIKKWIDKCRKVYPRGAAAFENDFKGKHADNEATEPIDDLPF